MKRCAKCGTEHPADTEHFGVDNKRHDGLNVWCKRCLVEGSRASRRRNAEYVKAAAKQDFQMRQKAKAAARAKWLDIARKAEAAPLALALLLAAPAAADEPSLVPIAARCWPLAVSAEHITEGSDLLLELRTEHGIVVEMWQSADRWTLSFRSDLVRCFLQTGPVRPTPVGSPA